MARIAKLCCFFVMCGALSVPAHSATLRIATVAPEGSSWVTAMRAGAKEVSEQTEGRVKLKFYTGGVMGSDAAVMRKMRIKQLDGASLGIGSLEARYPDIVLYGLPMVFRDHAEADYVRERMDEQLRVGLAKAGLVTYGIAEGGFARMMSSFPIRNLDDVRGKKIWVPEGDRVSYAAMEALGLAPVTLPITDVLTGLQTRLLDAVAIAPVGALAFQWHTKVKYMTDMPVAYTAGILAIEEKSLKKVSPADRKVLRSVMERIYDEFDEGNRPDNAKATEALIASGVEMVQADPDDVPRWREAVTASTRREAQKGTFDSALLDQLEGHLNDFRTNARASTAEPASTN